MNVLRLSLVFVVAMAAQWLWAAHLAVWGVAPQLLLVLTVAVAARRGPLAAMTMGFLWGLFLDILNVRLFGASALALTIVGYGTGSVRRQIDVTGLGPQCVVVFFMTWAYFLMMGLLGLVFARTFLWVGWPQFLVDPFYNVILATAVFILWDPSRER